MSKVFICPRCKCDEMYLQSCIYQKNEVEVDDDGSIYYNETEDDVYEEYTGYACTNCCYILDLDGIVVDNENDLKRYLEIYGTDEINTSPNNELFH